MPDAGFEPACLAATAFEAAASAGSANRALVWGAWSGSNRRPPDSHSGALPLRHTHHRIWSPRRGSNSRPHAPKARALPTALRGEKSGRRGGLRSRDLVLPKHADCLAFLHTDETGSRGWTRSSDLSLIKRVLFRLSYATERTGSPTWVRTTDIRINSAALCQLSYREMNGSPLADLTHALREIEFGFVAACTPRVTMPTRGRIGDASHDREHDTVARARCARGNDSGTHVHLLW